MSELDDFFDDVDEAEAVAEKEELEQPVAKKQKLEEPAQPVQIISKTTVFKAPVLPNEVSASSSNLSVPVRGVPPPPPPSARTGNVSSKPSSSSVPSAPSKSTSVVRSSCGKTWVDTSLADFPENDYRLFIGDLSRDATNSDLTSAFSHFKSLALTKVIFDNMGKPKGFGFVSLLSFEDAAKAIREMNGKYIRGRPIKVKRSEWKDRDKKEVKKKNKKEEKRKRDLGLN
ncbi:hypothetical protein TrST_g400 [Triparma strigata]|uniref:RRM domain-containing protein n=1 Tax=Triparma strigata TaxID=1606541 RepID=A0A9W7BHJ9_9STRA|nr:hypothetical protein TrST_g400 [Triparma strigata]